MKMQKRTYSDINEYAELHQSQINYGATGHTYANKILTFVKKNNPATILDFGCGKGTLATAISSHGIRVDCYDPAISDKNSVPLTQYDMIITTDVLEHIHEDELENIFHDILCLAPLYMYHVICNRSAHSILPNGTNAHKTVKNYAWWVSKLTNSFNEYSLVSHRCNDLTFCELSKNTII